MDTITFAIDGKTKREFHIICLSEDVDMSKVLRNCVEKYIGDHKR